MLHSGAIGDSGDLCVLDMGEQVRIVDLAENMIRMTGKVPYDESIFSSRVSEPARSCTRSCSRRGSPDAAQGGEGSS